GKLSFIQGNYTQAIDDCTKAIEVNNLYKDAFYIRAKAYQSQGEVDKAKLDLGKVEKLGGISEIKEK
ncbi:MAG: tetratricopeptide repeat protein, partial [Deltaproteobacteria bacterium]|nr:tetratricopeptide repeat protein [Deltaproteobacteria bacterium]